MDYAPVCALRDAVIRCVKSPCPDGEWVTYSNAYTACADKRVQGYIKGPCREGEQR